MEQLDYNLLYRWFVGLSPDEGSFTTRGYHQARSSRAENFHLQDRFQCRSSDVTMVSSLWIAAARRRPRVLNHPAHPCNLIWAARDGWGKGNLTASKKPRVWGDSCGGF